eukprot:1875778-Rhodomonas_salina.1
MPGPSDVLGIHDYESAPGDAVWIVLVLLVLLSTHWQARKRTKFTISYCRTGKPEFPTRFPFLYPGRLCSAVPALRLSVCCYASVLRCARMRLVPGTRCSYRVPGCSRRVSGWLQSIS